MGKEITTFGNIDIEKYKFHHYKNPTFLNYVDIDIIFISKDISSNKKNYKYFIGYIDDFKIKSFIVIFPKSSAYIEK